MHRAPAGLGHGGDAGLVRRATAPTAAGRAGPHGGPQDAPVPAARVVGGVVKVAAAPDTPEVAVRRTAVLEAAKASASAPTALVVDQRPWTASRAEPGDGQAPSAGVTSPAVRPAGTRPRR